MKLKLHQQKITKSKKEIFQKLLQLYLQLSKVVEVKEEMKTTVVHGQEPDPSTSKDLKTEETVTLDDETWELMKSVKNHVGQGRYPGIPDWPCNLSLRMHCKNMKLQLMVVRILARVKKNN